MSAATRQHASHAATARTIFLDRDGTLVEARHYPTRPEELILCADLELELLALQGAGFRFVVATNQSGLARGIFDEAALDAMHEHLRGLLDAGGVALAGIYHCPHHPEGSVATWAIDCDCRKPAPGLLLRAADDLGIDLGRSWFVGDILDDCEAGNRAGCRTILVDRGTESAPTAPVRRPAFVARSSAHALRIIRAVEGLGPPADLDYRPPCW